MLKNYPFTVITGGGPKPYLWVRVCNPKRHEKGLIVPALIDTGADECAFPASAASPLGYRLKSSKSKSVITAGGVTTAYPHPVMIQVFDIDSNGDPTLRVARTVRTTNADFIKGLDGFLLGTRSFLARFVITIDYPRQTFSVR